MIIRCINGFQSLLTYGKTYKVYSTSFSRYHIMNDMGRMTWEYCKNFEVTDLTEADRENTKLYWLYRELEIFDVEVKAMRQNIVDKIKKEKG